MPAKTWCAVTWRDVTSHLGASPEYESRRTETLPPALSISRLSVRIVWPSGVQASAATWSPSSAMGASAVHLPADHRRSVTASQASRGQVSAAGRPSATQRSRAASGKSLGTRVFSPGVMLERSPESVSNQSRWAANTARKMKFCCPRRGGSRPDASRVVVTTSATASETMALVPVRVTTRLRQRRSTEVPPPRPSFSCHPLSPPYSARYCWIRA
jgi:hypothetical protein